MSRSHGETRGGKLSPEYRAWREMCTRATNRKRKIAKHYSLRGISVCPEWVGSSGFSAFLAHVGRKPSPDLTLDRIDNERGYEPGNVRWATRIVQAANRRPRHDLVAVTVDGVTRSLAQWEAITGVRSGTIYQRLHQYGWSPARAIMTPTGQMKSG